MTTHLAEPGVDKQKSLPKGFFPEASRLITMDGRDYVMIPLDEFDEWYEDEIDKALVEDLKYEDKGPGIPIEEILNDVEKKKHREAEMRVGGK